MKLIYFKYGTFKINWKKAWDNPSFRIQLITTLVFLSAIAIYIPDFFHTVQFRPGHRINDVLLNFFTPHNVSFFTFLSIYSAILLAIINIIPFPVLFLKSLQAYCLLVLMRMLSMYLLPLEPPGSIIPLEDPFIGYFFYNNVAITKDLFFSGHVSTLFLLFLSNPFRQLKYPIMILTVLTALLILLQHVHYTIDIIAAPVFSWISYKLAGRLPLSVTD